VDCTGENCGMESDSGASGVFLGVKLKELMLSMRIGVKKGTSPCPGSPFRLGVHRNISSSSSSLPMLLTSESSISAVTTVAHREGWVILVRYLAVGLIADCLLASSIASISLRIRS